MKIFKVDIPIFRRSVVCAHSCTSKEAGDAFYDFGAYNGDVFMWVEKPAERASVVFHELVHVACSLLDIIGADRDEEIRIFDECESDKAEIQ